MEIDSDTLRDFFAAVRAGDTATVLQCLDRARELAASDDDVDPDDIDMEVADLLETELDGCSPLIAAIESNQLEVYKLLVERGTYYERYEYEDVFSRAVDALTAAFRAKNEAIIHDLMGRDVDVTFPLLNEREYSAPIGTLDAAAGISLQLAIDLMRAAGYSVVWQYDGEKSFFDMHICTPGRFGTFLTNLAVKYGEGKAWLQFVSVCADEMGDMERLQRLLWEVRYAVVYPSTKGPREEYLVGLGPIYDCILLLISRGKIKDWDFAGPASVAGHCTSDSRGLGNSRAAYPLLHLMIHPLASR